MSIAAQNPARKVRITGAKKSCEGPEKKTETVNPARSTLRKLPKMKLQEVPGDNKSINAMREYNPSISAPAINVAMGSEIR